MALNISVNTIKTGGRRICSSSYAIRQFSSSPISHVKPRRQRQKEDPFALEKMGKFNFDDIPTAGHFILEEKRQELHYARLEEWELPKLMKFRQTYQPPKKEEILRIKNIHYQGESHPVTRKAVVTIRVEDLFTSTQKFRSKEAKRKFLLLAGSRWNPFEEKGDVLQVGEQSQTNSNSIADQKVDIFGDHTAFEHNALEKGGMGVIKISCERFPNLQMNLKWCSDVVDNMIEEANNKPEMMKDVPLDIRHIQARENSRKSFKRKNSPSLRDFPQEWLPGGRKPLSE